MCAGTEDLGSRQAAGEVLSLLLTRLPVLGFRVLKQTVRFSGWFKISKPKTGYTGV